MQIIDQIYWADATSQDKLEKALSAALQKVRTEIRVWVDNPYVERLEKLYSIVEYWKAYFCLTPDQTEELMGLAALVVKHKDYLPSSYDLNLYPIGVVRVRSVSLESILPLVMVNWVAGNAIILEGNYPNEWVSGLALITPFNGAIQCVHSMGGMKIIVDAHLDESWNQIGNSMDWVNRVSVMLPETEWNAKAVEVAKGY